MTAAGKALFVGDISLDTTLLMDKMPQPDEKLLVSITNEMPGGVVTNAALACRLAGAEVGLAVETGDDLFAESLLTPLRAAGIDVTGGRKPGRTCRAIVLLDAHGEKRLLLEPGVSMYPGAGMLSALDWREVGWLHTAVYSGAAESVIEHCRTAGIAWSIDLEPATFMGGLAPLHSVLDGAETVFCNQRALAQIGGDPVGQLLALGVKSVICTLGPQGARYVSAGACHHARFAGKAVVVDTTGAGDCLAGWYIARRLGGLSIPAALREAVYAATYSCGGMGAQSSYPTREQYIQFEHAPAVDATGNHEF
ncbi:carbohydrate kinase family protein [Sodalis sp. dw_96]|uniref:carbohydrate kinase family protein n=1 Tax=Sodalis sp. dw_96 TaxID=2719794 RepID=UPI001BD1EF22|nr:carbohydrate kinase family protein [Sodalis sp. dw_96]